MRAIIYTVLLAARWLSWSGIYKPLLVSFGAGSVLLVLLITHRMNRIDGDRLDISLNPIRFIGYFLWLFKEIAVSNMNVTRVILAGTMPIKQNLFRIPHTQKSDLGQVIFANSITLTPGTVTVETEENEFLVHALSYSEDDLHSLADMDRRVSATEMKSNL